MQIPLCLGSCFFPLVKMHKWTCLTMGADAHRIWAWKKAQNQRDLRQWEEFKVCIGSSPVKWWELWEEKGSQLYPGTFKNKDVSHSRVKCVLDIAAMQLHCLGVHFVFDSGRMRMQWEQPTEMTGVNENHWRGCWPSHSIWKDGQSCWNKLFKEKCGDFRDSWVQVMHKDVGDLPKSTPDLVQMNTYYVRERETEVIIQKTPSEPARCVLAMKSVLDWIGEFFSNWEDR